MANAINTTNGNETMNEATRKANQFIREMTDGIEDINDAAKYIQRKLHTVRGSLEFWRAEITRARA
jgi:hypothetical protein